ncbi:unnamed protein product [Polarella glacialis]|uniref:Uncharacterized protein n=1 Tax=Polarella glacialis TaxID=89957 RepID=A0A813LI35_POLGL|nr:unnamed protein product [Polarella glacialis]
MIASPSLQRLGGVVQGCGTAGAFAVIKNNGSVVTWGHPEMGGDSSSVAELLMTGDSTAIATLLAEGVVQVCGNTGAFAARKSNGSVVTWGDTFSSDSSKVAPLLTEGVVQVCGTNGACAALLVNGSVVTWGNDEEGGDSSKVATLLTEGVVEVYSNYYAFVALKADGSVVTWGCTSWTRQVATLLSDVVQVCGSGGAFAAIKSGGSVVTWGDDWGGDSSEVAALLTEGVVQICGGEMAFAAIKADGSVVSWGDSRYGGDSSAVASLLTEGFTMATAMKNLKARLKRKAAKLHRMADKMFVLKVSMQKLRGQIRAGVLAMPTSSSGSGSNWEEDTPTSHYAYTDTFLFKSTSVLMLAELDMIIEPLSSEHFSELFAVQSSNGMWTGFVQFVRPRNIRRLNVVPFRNPFEWTEWNYSADEAFGQFCSIGYVHEWGVFE